MKGKALVGSWVSWQVTTWDGWERVQDLVRKGSRAQTGIVSGPLIRPRTVLSSMSSGRYRRGPSPSKRSSTNEGRAGIHASPGGRSADMPYMEDYYSLGFTAVCPLCGGIMAPKVSMLGRKQYQHGTSCYPPEVQAEGLDQRVCNLQHNNCKISDQSSCRTQGLIHSRILHTFSSQLPGVDQDPKILLAFRCLRACLT
jgi:hypothetical protein